MWRWLQELVSPAPRREVEKRYAIDQWLTDYLIPSQFTYNGTSYPLGINQSFTGSRAQSFSPNLPGHMAALRACPPAFAAQMVRASVLSQTRFIWRNPPWHLSTPRRTFGTSELAMLERPSTEVTTTGELVARMEWHAGPAGNAFVYRRSRSLRVLRPDWTVVVHGSELEPEDPIGAIDREVIGYIYVNGGIHSGNTPRALLPDEVAHWSPLPDPESPGMGMSWITPAIREIQADRLATDHKIKFFENGATPNLVVKGIPAMSKDQFDEIVDAMEDRHAGLANAYRTLYLTAGADATVVGSDLKQIDFKATQGAGETRISVLSRVHPVILAIAEGMQGSSLNAGNFGMARRIWADTWIVPTLQDLAASLAPLLRVPNDAELWFDTQDMPILREDARDAAEIAQVKANAIRTLWDGGAEPMSAVATVAPEWMTTLQHTGKLSVQLQEPGAQPTNGGDSGSA